MTLDRLLISSLEKNSFFEAQNIAPKRLLIEICGYFHVSTRYISPWLELVLGCIREICGELVKEKRYTHTHIRKNQNAHSILVNLNSPNSPTTHL